MYQTFGVILNSTKNKEKKKAVSFLFILFYVYKCFFYLHVCMHHLCAVFTGDGVTDGCELPTIE